MKIKFLLVCGTCIILSLQDAFAQSWLITGNDNTTALSRLGTNNFIPLGLYTDAKERVHIDELGRVGIGISSPVNVLTVKSTLGAPVGSWLSGLTSPVFVGFAENASSEFVLATASNTSPRRSVIQGRRSRGTLDAPAAVLNDDYITSFLASGYDGNTFQNPATIDFFVDGVPSAGNVPARISFVTGSNQANRVERLKVGSTGNISFNNDQLTVIQATGNVGVGTTSPVYKLDVGGRSRIRSGNGTAGIWFMNPANTQEGSFIGTFSDDFAGLFGNKGAGWGFLMNLTNGNVGLGATSPAYKLDVGGRSRIRSGNGTAGIWFMNPANTQDASFIGTLNDDFAGLFGNKGAGWGVVMDLTSGNVGIGSAINPGFYKTRVSHQGFGFDIHRAATGNHWEMWVSGDAANASLNLWYNNSPRGSFNATNGVYSTGSDERIKTNIKPMTTMLEKINKLKPLTYQFKNTTDKQEYMGFIAQDVLKIFPSLVTHNVDKDRNLDLYTMDYSGFGVIAVKGIQELQPVVEEQARINEEQTQTILALEERLADLEAALAKFTGKSSSDKATVVNGAFLEQNAPNPMSQSTIIRYRLPSGSKGQIRIFDQNGNLLKTLIANQSGQSKLNAYDLTNGNYSYTLFVDGKLVNTKKLVVLK